MERPEPSPPMSVQPLSSAPPSERAARQQAWSRYWLAGPLHCLPGSFTGNYDGGIGAFWTDCFASLEAGHRVLDLCTGNGALPAMLAELRPATDIEVDAVDLAELSPRWLPGLPDAAQQRIRFHGGVYAESLPFPDASFDLAVSQYGIEYTRHEASIAELARTLRPGGRCAFVLHHAGSHLHAVAADEAAAARILLDGDGLLGHAASLLPYLALAAEGQVERLRADPAANQARAAFNAAAQAVGRSADSLRHPQLLLDAQQWVVEMSNAVVQRRAGAGEASARLAEYRQDIELAGLRSQELCSHALDEAGFERFSALLGPAGMSGVSGAPLWHRDYLVGWQLRARRN